MRILLRIVAALVLTLTLSSFLEAQSLGLKAGWAHPTLGGSDAQGLSARNTLAGGASLTLPLAAPFSLQAEALYIQKGAKGDVEGVTGVFKIGYIEVPLLAKLAIPVKESKLSPDLFAGPYVAFKASCKVGAEASGLSASVACADADAKLKSTDFGITFGGGVGFPLTGRISGLIDARYDLGLTKIDDSTVPSNVKNRAFMVFAGISFPIGPRPVAAASRVR